MGNLFHTSLQATSKPETVRQAHTCMNECRCARGPSKRMVPPICHTESQTVENLNNSKGTRAHCLQNMHACTTCARGSSVSDKSDTLNQPRTTTQTKGRDDNIDRQDYMDKGEGIDKDRTDQDKTTQDNTTNKPSKERRPSAQTLATHNRHDPQAHNPNTRTTQSATHAPRSPTRGKPPPLPSRSVLNGRLEEPF